MSQLVFSICQNPGEVVSNASEGMALPEADRDASFFHVLSIGCQQEVWQIKGGSSHLKRSGLEMSLPQEREVGAESVLRWKFPLFRSVRWVLSSCLGFLSPIVLSREKSGAQLYGEQLGDSAEAVLASWVWNSSPSSHRLIPMFKSWFYPFRTVTLEVLLESSEPWLHH